ncbi:protein FAM151B isoform X3 [Elephas maximus indicus]|uniref:protein FAM151B isoform X3 n=1 Tax=Elephas maximus indicus TaxID=99487 RepID=UPI0021161754|nr:protein FAM151B isoform X3 [Elephas maximus indicus]
MTATAGSPGTAHMIEADVLLPDDESEHGQPVMAHPPETSSDNTLQEWLAEVVKSNKGIKLDFKSLAAVEPSMMLLENVKRHLMRPVWINADILPGPNGSGKVVDAKLFIDTVTSFFPDVTFSLGWTTGWHPQKVNEGYSWPMVEEMEYICHELSQPVTFPVRAALVGQSCSQLLWLLKKSDRFIHAKRCFALPKMHQLVSAHRDQRRMKNTKDTRYSLTVWTGKDDNYSVEDLLCIRDHFDKSQVFYDILEPQNYEFKQAVGIKVNL